MSCLQASGLCTNLPTRPLTKRIHNTPFRTSLKLNAASCKPLSRQLNSPIRRSPVCLFGGDKDKSQDEGAPWKSFGKALENFNKGQSIEDVLRQQMEKKEYYDGSGGKDPPSDGGGGGGGGGGEGTGQPGDEGSGGIVDETVQVILATLAFICMYIYILKGQELIRLARDYIRYRMKGTKSVRLINAMEAWQKFKKKITDEEETDSMWLEKAIINTPTMYDSPQKYRRLFGYATEPESDDSDGSDFD